MNTPSSWDPLATYQRRSFSFGDCPLSSSTHDSLDVDDELCQTPENGQDYICAPLPRSDNVPTAKTCWLVLSLICSFNVQR